MATTAPYAIETIGIAVLEEVHRGRALATYGIGRPGRLRWPGLSFPRIGRGWQDLKLGMHPLKKIRWAWVLLLAIVLVLALGECGPAASAIAALR